MDFKSLSQMLGNRAQALQQQSDVGKEALDNSLGRVRDFVSGNMGLGDVIKPTPVENQAAQNSLMMAAGTIAPLSEEAAVAKQALNEVTEKAMGNAATKDMTDVGMAMQKANRAADFAQRNAKYAKMRKLLGQ